MDETYVVRWRLERRISEVDGSYVVRWRLERGISEVDETYVVAGARSEGFRRWMDRMLLLAPEVDGS